MAIQPVEPPADLTAIRSFGRIDYQDRTHLGLRDRIISREARVAIMGCGYVGLPLGVAFAEAGFHVLGVEIDHGRAAALERGQSYILDVSTDRLSKQVRAGRFRVTSCFDDLREADAIFVSVPTPFD